MSPRRAPRKFPVPLLQGIQAQGISFSIARVTDELRAQPDRYGLTDLVGAGGINDTIDVALAAPTKRRY